MTMPWMWQDPGGGMRTRRRRRRATRRRARSYFQPYSQYEPESYEYQDHSPWEDSDDWDHDQSRQIGGLDLYDRNSGRPVRLDIQSPSDMLPPYADRSQWAPGRRRARF